MTRARLILLLLGPVPIVAGALALSTWARPSSSPGVTGNHVLAADEPHREATTSKSEVQARIESHLTVACQKTAEQLRPQLGKECAVLIREPFVLAGDMSETDLDQWYQTTIAPAAKALGRSYFRKSPTLPITVLLFSSEASYNRYAKQLFNESGISVYGYYKPDRRTLVMNISTGGGTLIHELTHALIDFDFPQVPDWFNEGLASLYEQCRFKLADSGIEGLPNWRLPGLQQAIQKQELGTLEAMMAGSEFRGKNIGRNYAQARYFCLYLQEKKLLEEFYRRIKADVERDPRGIEAARSMFNDEQLKTLDRDFQAWVLTLQF